MLQPASSLAADTPGQAPQSDSAAIADPVAIPTPAAVELVDVSVSYHGSLALAGISLRIEAGECVALLGPSGWGKSTALKAIAGFVPLASGQVMLGGRDVSAASPAERGIGVVVQSYALFPHLRVE